jgi:hypothetical protein
MPPSTNFTLIDFTSLGHIVVFFADRIVTALLSTYLARHLVDPPHWRFIYGAIYA